MRFLHSIFLFSLIFAHSVSAAAQTADVSPWQSGWVVALFAAFIGLAVAFIAHVYIQRRNQKVVAELKDDFIAKISHEIRTPINAVVGLSRLALNAQTETERLDHISTVLDSGDALLELINDVLDISKINANQMTIEQTELDVSKVLSQTLNLCALRAHEKGLELAVVTDGPIPAGLIGDPVRLRQVLVNLVNNAVKFTDTGGVWIKLRFEPGQGRQVKMCCAVTDTGCGMTEQQQAKLFKSYVQADDSVTRTHGGTGLGLSIAKQLCGLMGGEIWIESKVGVGSTFHFTVSLTQAEEPDTAATLEGLSALVVDDVDFCADAVVSQLKAMGVSVEMVENGEKAIEQIEAAEEAGSPYDLLLADWLMPGIDGIETLLSIDDAVPMQILLVGRYDKELFRRHAADFQDLNIIEKPVLPGALFEAVSTLLSGAGLYNQHQQARRMTVPELACYRILLVEDNAINRQVAMGFLQYTGAEIELAENGLVAVERIKQGGIDLVLMDIEMAKMDGLAATKAIRDELNLTDLPIIAMTGHAMPGDGERFNKAGMNGHITKPFKQEVLYQVIGRHLAHEDFVVSIGAESSVQTDGEASHAMQQLERISGLQVRSALTRLNGKTEMYTALVRDFVQVGRSLPADFDAWYKSQAWKRIVQGAHSLKSNAGFIGAQEVARLADIVENGFRAEQYHYQALSALIKALSHLLGQLRSVPLDTHIQVQCEAFDINTFKKQLKDLIGLLDSSDFAAEEHLAQLEAYCVDSDFAKDIDVLINHVDDVEFELATVYASQLVERLSISAHH